MSQDLQSFVEAIFLFPLLFSFISPFHLGFVDLLVALF
jgi:hypothetical protein